MTDKYFLNQYPAPEELRKKLINNSFPPFREINGHIHTPYSFSAFHDMETIFSMAKTENIAVLGINDFFVTDGFNDFYDFSLRNRVFPLFNMEFIGLIRDHQKNGIRINDPNNPGRIYISGKGLDFPFNPGLIYRARLTKAIRASQNQMKAMISKLNGMIESINPSLRLSYDKIKDTFAHGLVRERHLARAVRSIVFENYSTPEDQTRFIESLYNGKKCLAGLTDHALLENEIRSNLLKKGGLAFVEEDKSCFLDVYSILNIIIKGGGIPCYPVLLDDLNGRFTEFEQDPQKLHKALLSMKIGCIELIPGRNDHSVLRNFIEYFYEKDYLILIGTEHNTPDMLPLTVTARGNEQLDEDLKQIAWNSACVIAAHQYLRAQGRQGYVLPDGNPSLKQKRELTYLGKLVIEYFLLNK